MATTSKQLAGIDARILGHAIAVIVGLVAIVAGIAALATGKPDAMGISLVIIGGLLGVMTWFSLQNSRAAWSLLVAILAVFATVTLFGAPTIRKHTGINLGIALIFPALQIIAVIALATIRENYRED